MNKKIITAGVMGMTGLALMTGCSFTMTPEQKAIKTFHEVADILFEYESEKDVNNIKDDLKAKYDLIDFEDDVDEEVFAEFYSTIFNGKTVGKDLVEMFKDMDIDFDSQYAIYEKLEEDDFYIKENPKIYIGDGDFMELEGMYFIYNEEPLIQTLVDDDDEEEKEVIMPIIMDGKGKIKAFAVISEDERETADEIFKSKKGIGYALKDLQTFTDELVDAFKDAFNELDNQSVEEYDGLAYPGPEKEEEPESEKNETIHEEVGNYIGSSTLNYEKKEDSLTGYYYVATDKATGLEGYYSESDYSEYLTLDISIDNVDSSLFEKEAEIAMKTLGLSSSEREKVFQSLKDVQDEKFIENNKGIQEDLEEYGDFFGYDVIDSENNSVTLYRSGIDSRYDSIELKISKYKS